jgi:hypothetical protein
VRNATLGGMTLTPEHLEAFTAAGDGRFVFAAWRDAPERDLFYLEDGQGHEVRQLAKAELQCFVPGCEAPQIVAVAPAKKRHHFRHLRRPNDAVHSPESVAHLQGKAAVAAWLRAACIGTVTVEGALDTQRSAIADIMLELPGGSRVAFEVQYASITVAELDKRRSRYRDQQVRDVWLWGHTGRNLLRGADGTIALTDAQRSMAARGDLIAWLNPERGELAIAVSRQKTAERSAYAPARPTDREVRAIVVALGQLSPSARGLDGAPIDQLRAIWLAVEAERRAVAQRAERTHAELQARVQAANAKLSEQSHKAAQRARVKAAIDASVAQLATDSGDAAFVARAVFSSRNLGEPSKEAIAEIRRRLAAADRERRRRERAARTQHVIQELGISDETAALDDNAALQRLNGALRSAGLSPANHRQERQFTGLIRSHRAFLERRALARATDAAWTVLLSQDFAPTINFVQLVRAHFEANRLPQPTSIIIAQRQDELRKRGRLGIARQ